ncbi:MAG: hypothetical protein QOJ34_980 [Pseudonocardiales bacterium]|nr:hypothetical protein [Pseudonocardiales bacterium]
MYPLIATLLLVAWLPASGAYSPAVFCAGAVGVVILLVATLSHGLPRLDAAKPRAVSIAAALLFAAWNYASIGWARDAGAAFDGANRTALFAGVFCLFALTAWTPRLVYAAMATFAAGVAVVTFIQFITTTESSNPGSEFITSRFTSIVGYPNASAALLLMAALAAVVIASRRSVNALVRGLMLAAATACVDIAILVQSRGSAFAAAAALLVALALVPARHRLLVGLAATGGCVAISARALAHVYTASSLGEHAFRSALHQSLRMSIIGVAVALLGGLIWSGLDRVVSLGVAGRYADRAVLVLVIGAVAAPVVVAAAQPHAAGHLASKAWRSFSRSGSPTSNSNRFSSLGSSRYDAYRVSLDEVRRHPLVGIGSDNFAIEYLQHRRTAEELLYPHSDVLRVPLQTGAVGTLLGIVFGIAFAIAAFRSWRVAPAAATVLLTVVAYWVFHSAADWFWEVPGVTAPVAAAAGAAVSLRETATGLEPLRRRTAVAAIALAVAAAVPLAVGWLSSREVDSALAGWRNSPAASVSMLNRAASLNPFSDRPYLLAAAIAGRVGDRGAMAVELQRADQRSDANWYTHLLLAIVAADGHRWAQARNQVKLAARLNPREETIRAAALAIARKRPLDLQHVNDAFLSRAQHLVRSGVNR